MSNRSQLAFVGEQSRQREREAAYVPDAALLAGLSAWWAERQTSAFPWQPARRHIVDDGVLITWVMRRALERRLIAARGVNGAAFINTPPALLLRAEIAFELIARGVGGDAHRDLAGWPRVAELVSLAMTGEPRPRRINRAAAAVTSGWSVWPLTGRLLAWSADDAMRRAGGPEAGFGAFAGRLVEVWQDRAVDWTALAEALNDDAAADAA